jgi:hypothetical protein
VCVRISVCEVCVAPAFLFRRALWNLANARLKRKAGATNQCRVFMPGTHVQFSRTLVGVAHSLTDLCRPFGALVHFIGLPHRFTVGYDVSSLTGLAVDAKGDICFATEVILAHSFAASVQNRFFACAHSLVRVDLGLRRRLGAFPQFYCNRKVAWEEAAQGGSLPRHSWGYL